MHIKDEVLAKGSFDIKDGTNTRFWDDTWVGDKPLKVKYPSLYNIVRDPCATISKVMALLTVLKYQIYLSNKQRKGSKCNRHPDLGLTEFHEFWCLSISVGGY